MFRSAALRASATTRQAAVRGLATDKYGLQNYINKSRKSMKQLFMFASQMLVAFACLAFTACSSDDDGDGGGGANGNPLDNLVGSEWSCEYYNVGDNGEYEEGTIQLMFVSSDRAEEHVTYSGMEWNIDDDYVRYSGTNDNFYTYTVSGNSVTLVNSDNGYSKTLTLLDNTTLTEGTGDVYTLVKAGSGSGDDDEGGNVSVGGNPQTGIADFVSAPVRSFAMEFSQSSRDFKVEYDYAGNKVVRMRRSGTNSGSFAVTYTDSEVTAASQTASYTFGLGAPGYANYFRDKDGYVWSCRVSGDNDGYIRYFEIDNINGRRYYTITYSGGNVSSIEEYHDQDLYCTYNFSYTGTDNKNGLYPEASIIDTGLEYLHYLGFLGLPSRKLVDKINFKPVDSSYGTMQFSYERDSEGNVTSYQYTSDPIYKTTNRRQPSPVFKFTY